MNKELIKQRFSGKLSLYNENARIQKQMAEELIKLLKTNDNYYSDIMEVGCGTGLLTELAVKKLTYQTYTALDIVEDCKKYINEINQNIEFVVNDIEELKLTNDKKYDLIISNASLQWVEDLPKVVENLLFRLNKNGILLFSTFGKENFREINQIIGKTLHYYSKEELQKLYPEAFIKEEVRIMAFKTPKDVLKHIRNTGVNAISAEVWTKKDLMMFEKEYIAICSNHPTLTYHPMYIKIQK